MSATLPPSLKQVRSALQQHRRQFGRQRIPDIIRREVVSLLALYPRKQVVNTLGISYKMLCSWERAALVPERSPDTTAMTFVQLPAETTEPLPDTDSDLPAIELRFAPEVILAFHGAGAIMQCLQLLQGLGYGRDRVAENPGVPV